MSMSAHPSMYRPVVPETHPSAVVQLPNPEPDGFLSRFLKNLDTQQIMMLLGITATIGISSAAIYFGQQRSQEKDKVFKKKSRVAFQDEKNVSDNSDCESGLSGDSSNTDQNGNPTTVQSLEYAGSQNNNVLVLKQCPRGRKTPCIAPFPLKLETFLRVHKIKYELDFNGYEPKIYGSPWIRFNTEDITESQNVVQFLIDTYNLRSEIELSGEQRAISTAYSHLLENHLYWGIALWRWVYDGARSLKDIQLLPQPTQQLIPDVCRTVEQAAWFHGIGKMSPEDVRKAVIQDLGSLSEYLADKEYFLNTSKPTELDCTAFGMLAQFLWNMNGPFHDAVADQFKNLREFCWRMRLNYWPDWEECLNNTEYYTDEPYPAAVACEGPTGP